MPKPTLYQNPHAVLDSASLANIEELLPELATLMPAWAETVQLLVNNVRNGRIALNAAVERIGLNLDRL